MSEIYFTTANQTITLQSPLRLANRPGHGTLITALGTQREPIGVTIDAVAVTQNPTQCAFMIDGGSSALHRMEGFKIRVQRPDQAICDESGRDISEDAAFDGVEIEAQDLVTDDGDYVPQNIDRCPQEAGLGRNQGCPEHYCFDAQNQIHNKSYDSQGREIDRDHDAINDACDPQVQAEPVPTGRDLCRGNTVVNFGYSRFDDLDGDGVGDACDGDIDGDGVSNAREWAAHSNPEDARSTPDTMEIMGGFSDRDNDGIRDDVDNCPDVGSRNTAQADSDHDGLGNVCDSDDDNDGLPDETDACPLAVGEACLRAVVGDDTTDLDPNSQDALNEATPGSGGGCSLNSNAKGSFWMFFILVLPLVVRLRSVLTLR